MGLSLKELVRGVALAKQFVGQGAQQFHTAHLLAKERRCEHRQRRKALLDELQVGGLAGLPGAKVFVLDFVRQEPVADHGVGAIAVEVDVGVGALGLFDDHALGVDHQSQRRVGRV